jgi:adenosylcobinamide kinase/adenosylcobinamide-phosphate guanylyltransferase
MSRGKRILIGGSVRSGKSAFAVALARQLGSRRTFVATAQGLDDEMRERIARHRKQRGDEFQTIEEPFDLPAVLGRLTETDVVVVDCLTLWLSNLLVRGDTEATILTRVEELIAVTNHVPFDTVMVTNEVGMGVHPEHRLGRAFRDVAGRAHQCVARGADEIYFAALGIMLRLHPGPIERQPLGDDV